MKQFVRTRLTVLLLGLAIGLGGTGLTVASMSPTVAHASGSYGNEQWTQISGTPHAGWPQLHVWRNVYIKGWVTLYQWLGNISRGSANFYSDGAWYSWNDWITPNNGRYTSTTCIIGPFIPAAIGCITTGNEWTYSGWQNWGSFMIW